MTSAVRLPSRIAWMAYQSVRPSRRLARTCWRLFIDTLPPNPCDRASAGVAELRADTADVPAQRTQRIRLVDLSHDRAVVAVAQPPAVNLTARAARAAVHHLIGVQGC